MILRVARTLGRNLLVALLTTDLAVAVAVAIAVAGAFVGYGRAWHALWTWRQTHVTESLAIAALVLVALTWIRRRRQATR